MMRSICGGGLKTEIDADLDSEFYFYFVTLVYFHIYLWLLNVIPSPLITDLEKATVHIWHETVSLIMLCGSDGM